MTGRVRPPGFREGIEAMKASRARKVAENEARNATKKGREERREVNYHMIYSTILLTQ